MAQASAWAAVSRSERRWVLQRATVRVSESVSVSSPELQSVKAQVFPMQLVSAQPSATEAVPGCC